MTRFLADGRRRNAGRRWSSLLVGAIAALVMAGLVGPLVSTKTAAAAPTFAVNTTADGPDANPGDGVCATSTGACSLRAAITEADAAPGGADISVPAGTYLLASSFGGLFLTNTTGPVVVTGAGSDSTIVDGGRNGFHVFTTESSVDVTLSGLTVKHGGSDGVFLNGNNASVLLSHLVVTANSDTGVVLYGTDNLAIADSTVSDNVASFVGGVTVFGGGTVSITGTTISGNTATSAGGGDGVGGGVGFLGSGPLTISGSTITGNHAGLIGGGLYQGGSHSVVVTNSTISDNTAGQQGGGVFVDNGAGPVTLDHTTVSGNQVVVPSGGSTGGDGGGVFVGTNASASLVNSVVSSNTVTGRGGGASVASGATLTLDRSTVSANSASMYGSGSLDGVGGAVINQGGSLTVTNSTLADNSAAASGAGIANGGTAGVHFSTINGNTAGTGGGDLEQEPAAGTLSVDDTILATGHPANCSGAMTSGGYNLDDGNSCLLQGTGDQADTTADLGPLQDNGGPTLTEALSSGSAAIDAATPFCPPPGVDQRGNVRPVGPRCDIGSVEGGSGGGGTPPPLTLTVSASAQVDPGSISDLPVTATVINDGTPTLTGVTTRIIPGTGLALASGQTGTVAVGSLTGGQSAESVWDLTTPAAACLKSLAKYPELQRCCETMCAWLLPPAPEPRPRLLRQNVFGLDVILQPWNGVACARPICSARDASPPR